jgi:cell division control protein 7
LYTPPPADPRYYPYNTGGSRRGGTHPPTSSSPLASSSRLSRSPAPSDPDAETHRADVLAAIDLAEQLLDPESTKRLGPRHALRHRFLAEEGAPDDDELAPQRAGRGVCGHLHLMDSGGAPCVRVKVTRGGRVVEEVRRIIPGEGVAYGSRPCEFHVDDVP